MVASSGKPLNIHDAYSDQRFDAEVDKVLGFRTKCLLTHPVLHDGEVIAVLQVATCPSRGWGAELNCLKNI